MTWPIDVAEELKELDEDREPATDYAILLRAQLAYKASLLQPGALSALVAIMTPALAKTKRYILISRGIYLRTISPYLSRDRTERDGQIINVILHAFRNLAFIKDTPDIEQVEFSSLQVTTRVFPNRRHYPEDLTPAYHRVNSSPKCKTPRYSKSSPPLQQTPTTLYSTLIMSFY